MYILYFWIGGDDDSDGNGKRVIFFSVFFLGSMTKTAFSIFIAIVVAFF